MTVDLAPLLVTVALGLVAPLGAVVIGQVGARAIDRSGL